MKGIRSGVAARIGNYVPQALPVHCLAHCLNLCLQDAGKQINLMRDAIQLVREIVQLINCSPKESIFSQSIFWPRVTNRLVDLTVPTCKYMHLA